MKVKKNKKEKGIIDNKSIQSIEEFNKSIKEWNLKMHKCCIGILIVINICLLIFFLIYKFQINSLNLNNIEKCVEISKEETIQKNYNSKAEYMLVNMYSNIYYDYYFSYFFKNIGELEKIKDLLITTPNLTIHKKEQIHSLLIYSSMSPEKINCEIFREKIYFYQNIMILIETLENKRFGFFWPSSIDDENVTLIKDKNAFIFDFNSQKKYMVKDNVDYAINIPINGDILLNVGNGDFIIYSSSINEGKSSKSNFPVSFEKNGETNNPFSSDGDINIVEFEIYSMIFYE